MRDFWAGMRLAVMNRQPGLTWREVGQMTVFEFFTVLKISEKQQKESSGGGSSASGVGTRAEKAGMKLK